MAVEQLLVPADQYAAMVSLAQSVTRGRKIARCPREILINQINPPTIYKKYRDLAIATITNYGRINHRMNHYLLVPTAPTNGAIGRLRDHLVLLPKGETKPHRIHEDD